ncbi:MFS transporter [Kitasatospora sp. NPDC101801]|uniref:MFS transporter n=1 Tax=Kitasatospora sp. NPDC101801 TaxID=3364103 RepID=UPI003830DF36
METKPRAQAAGRTTTGRKEPSGAPVLIAVALASVLLPLAVTAPAVALPDLVVDLNASVSAGQWVQNAYGVTFAACMLAAGALADQFGRRRILAVGAVVFMAMSAVSALSTNIVVLDLARALQGIGAAGVLTSGAAILAASFEGRKRTQAFGVLGASFGAGLALGPILGGALVGLAGWRAVFWLNVVVGVIALSLMSKIRESRDPNATTVDWGGLVTFSGGLFFLALAFVKGGETGWLSGQTLASLGGFVLFMAAFVAVELRAARPMFDLSLFRNPTFVVVVCQPFTITFGFVVLLNFLPPYFNGLGGASDTASGTLLLPLTLPVFVLPLLVGRLVAGRVSSRLLLTMSSLLIAVGSLWLVVLEPGQPWYVVAGPLLVFGLGVGSAFGAMDNAAVGVVPVERAGMASGIFNTMRIAGESVAIASAGGFLASLTRANLAERVPELGDRAGVLAGAATQGSLDTALADLAPAERAGVFDAVSASLTSSLHVAFLGLTVLALVGAVVTFLVVKDRELDSADGSSSDD